MKRLRLPGGALIAAPLVVALLVVALHDPALAQQTGPFGAPRPPAQPPADGLIGWILAKQGQFYREFSGLIRAAKTDGSAAFTLLGVAFLYGVFHAAGPGHGKAVISSYMIASGETWRRGVILSFISAMIQSVVAIVLVTIAAGIIGVTSRVMGETVRWIEIASYALIALLGVQLTWSKGRSFLRALGGATGHDTHHHDHAAHAHHDHAHHDHAHDHDHSGHSHGPTPQELEGPGGWQRGLSAVIAVGLRPCSGAILVLVFALAQGLYWAGVAATFMIGLGTALMVALIATIAVGARSLAGRLASSGGSGRGVLAVRGLELAAALAVLAFGIALLMGYMATERMF